MELQIKRRFNEKELPDMKSIKAEAEKLASGICIGETLFMKEKRVKSEAEYKRRMMECGTIMKHSVIGWNSWSTTVEGFQKVYGGLKEAGSYIDRLGVCLDWVMGVPEEYRHKIQAGGGLIFKSQKEWNEIGQIVPVQPHLGDHMIGSLNGVENTMRGLQAGATTIGNLAQYFTFEYPGIEMEKYRTEDYVKAIAIMAHFREEGAIIHSNLDDGYGAQFHDLANLAGWARIERYIAEELLGARTGLCYGNLFSDAYTRVVFNRAMAMINKHNTPGSFVNGNTIDYGMSIPRNYGALCSYSLADIVCQMKYPTGHAIAPVPLTEAVRVPSPEEIVEAHLAVDMMIEKAPYYEKFFNWEKINLEAEVLVTGGNAFFERVINAFDDMGIDIEHAGQVTATLKAIGPKQLETAFGAGVSDKNAMRGRIPIRPTSIVQTIGKIQDEVIVKQDLLEKPLSGVNVVVGSTDVHEFGIEVIKNVVKEAGANVFDLGTTVSAEEVADMIVETGSIVVLMSTYNGVAYSFGKALMENLKKANLDNVHVVMGGRLNEPMEDSGDLPVDVSDKLKEMGINVDNDVDTLVSVITSYVQA